MLIFEGWNRDGFLNLSGIRDELPNDAGFTKCAFEKNCLDGSISIVGTDVAATVAAAIAAAAATVMLTPFASISVFCLDLVGG